MLRIKRAAFVTILITAFFPCICNPCGVVNYTTRLCKLLISYPVLGSCASLEITFKSEYSTRGGIIG